MKKNLYILYEKYKLKIKYILLYYLYKKKISFYVHKLN